MDPQLTWNDDENSQNRIQKSSINHETVFQMWEAGIRDIEEIALETAYSPSYVRTLLKARGFDLSTAKVLSDENAQGICTDYQNGMKISKILRTWGISNNALYKLLEDRNIPIRKGSHARRPFLDRAIEMYQEGTPIKEIRHETGVVPSILYDELENRGLSTRVQPRLQDTVLKRAVDMYQGDQKLSDIYLETGVGASTLYNELQKSQIPLRKKSDNTVRLDEAVILYERGADVDTIMTDTGVGTQQLYNELHHRGIKLRNGKMAQGVDVPLAYELYDKGEPFSTIQKVARITLVEMVDILKKRNLNLRTGLPTRVIRHSIDVAIQEYQDGVMEDDITIDTLITKVQLLAELRKRGLEIRP